METKEGWFSPAVFADFDASFKLSIIANNEDRKETVSFTVGPIKSECRIDFPVNTFSSGAGYIRSADLSNKHITEPILFGSVHYLRVDYLTGIFSGQFEFDLYSNTGDTLHITEGRFDIKK